MVKEKIDMGMKVGKYLTGAFLFFGLHVGVMAQSNNSTSRDAQAKAEYEVDADSKDDPDKGGDRAVWSGQKIEEAKLHNKSADVDLLETGISEREAIGVDVSEAFHNEAFFESLAKETGRTFNGSDFEYTDEGFQFIYEKSGEKAEIKANGDPSKFFSKYCSFMQNSPSVAPATSDLKEAGSKDRDKM